MFVKAIQGIDIKDIRARLDAIDQPWQPSTLYAQAAKETVEEPSLRNSEARVLVDAALFACAERIVAGIEDDEYNFSLVCDDVTHLRYTPGAFFTMVRPSTASRRCGRPLKQSPTRSLPTT